MENRAEIFHFSWLNKEYRGAICKSKVRDQTDVGPASCPHHSVGAVLEMMQWRKLQEEGRADERKDLDVKDMYNRYIKYRNSEGLCGPSSTKKLLEWLKDNDARAEDGPEVFKLKDFTDVKPLDNIGGVSFLLSKLFEHGPFVGVFTIKRDHISSGVQDIYLCDGRPVIYNLSTSPNVLRPVRHSVAVVGFGIDNNFHPFWEHLETVSPDRTTFQGRGVRRVFVTGIDRAFVLDV